MKRDISRIFNNNTLEKLDKIKNDGEKTKLLLHVCCVICASSVIEILMEYFEVILFFYNPNIHPREEYNKRLFELKRYLKEKKLNIDIIEGEYETSEFFVATDRWKNEKEGGMRCSRCFDIRLRRTMEKAKELEISYISTTLSLGPMKNSDKINEVGKRLENEYNIEFIEANFKKNEGYKRSLELCNEFNIYRQNYCGCIYSSFKENK